MRPARSSMRSCTTAYASRPVRGSRSPTGFIGPKRSVSRPRFAISSTGMHPSKYGTSSNSCAVALVGGDERVDERLVLLARHRAVEVRAFARSALVHRLLAVARRAEDDVVVDRVARDDRRDGVVERERLDTEPRRGSPSASASEVSGPVATMPGDGSVVDLVAHDA